MPLKNTPGQWGTVSKLLHWLIVVLILLMAWIGLRMGDMPNGPDKIASYAMHKSVGISILVLAVVRLLWRLHAGAPTALAAAPGWQRGLASSTHVALYGLLLAMPLSGWLMNSYAGFPLQWFGLFNLPEIAARNHDLHELTESVHEWLFWTLMTVAILHAAAAFYHHLFQRDATLARMLPEGWLRMDPTEDIDAP